MCVCVCGSVNMSCLSKHWGCVLDMALQMSPSHLSLKASSFWRKIQTIWRVRTNVIHNDITCTQLWLCSYYGLLLLCCTPLRNMQCMFGLEHCTLARGQATPIEGVFQVSLVKKKWHLPHKGVMIHPCRSCQNVRT